MSHSSTAFGHRFARRRTRTQKRLLREALSGHNKPCNFRPPIDEALKNRQ
jgi:hypothetical protein